MTNEELWQAVLAQVQFTVSRANFATWFRNTKIVSNEKGKVLISVPNSFAKEWLSNKYHSLILKILRSLDKEIKVIDFVVDSKNSPLLKTKSSSRLKKAVPIGEPQLQFQEFKIDQKTNLNPRYTFDNFVVGGFNELAHAAAWAVSENPGAVYNPLFIYGGVGLGKTHLLQATGNRIVSLFPEKKVKYTTAESFISGIVEAIRNQEIEELKKKLRKIDVLIMDDVQFFAGKEKTQEEFFHIFNSLYQTQKQIILSSDRPPNAIPAIEERLRSRFEGGMIADIGIPDFETRIAILKAKCEEKDINLSQEVLEYIASNIQKNIREMEGALNRLVIFYKINQKIPNLEVAKKLLRSLIISPKKSTSFKKIIKVVASFYDLEEKELLLPTRRKEIVKPRQIAMYLLRQELKESYPSIGRRFKGKDHTTAIYACEKITKQLEEDDNLLTEINLIRQRLYNEF
ncbi:MAG: chromosomal replication initiator protein DnaA [Candidatus Nealsonbacteria bacterium]|nr:MAG: chromosomal replication initiator protein DnaA [Candidatus Nealsonbacteria bacterium]